MAVIVLLMSTTSADNGNNGGDTIEKQWQRVGRGGKTAPAA